MVERLRAHPRQIRGADYEDVGMKRIPAFLLLGPVLSWLVCVAIAFALTPSGQPIFEDDRYWLASFMVCTTFALLPLWATAYIDRKLSQYWWRPIVCFVAGFGMATVLHYMITHEGGVEANMQIYRESWFYVGLVWALPAAICSLISER